MGKNTPHVPDPLDDVEFDFRHLPEEHHFAHKLSFWVHDALVDLLAESQDTQIYFSQYQFENSEEMARFEEALQGVWRKLPGVPASGLHVLSVEVLAEDESIMGPEDLPVGRRLYAGRSILADPLPAKPASLPSGPSSSTVRCRGRVPVIADPAPARLVPC